MKKPKTGSTLNGQPIKITDSWEKMNFIQYLRNMKRKTDDKIELASILTGLDYEYIKKAKLTGLDNLLYIARFIDTPAKFDPLVTHIGHFKLPLNSKGVFDVQFESLAQFEDMRVIMLALKGIPAKEDFAKYELQEILDRIYEHTEAYAKYCAIYVQKLRDGEYDGDKAMAMVPEVMTYPASHVITAGSFFFIKLMSLLTGTVSNSQSSAQARKKSTGKRSKRNSGRTPRLTKSHAK
jgi:hypothetical protein